MLNFTDFTKFKTPTDVILFQANLAKSTLAFVPDENLRARLNTAIEMNAALATAFWDALLTYGTTLKAEVLEV
jgi:hypothetical protein